jgi:hypothetical protein
MPLAFSFGVLLGFVWTVMDKNPQGNDFWWPATVMDAAVVFGCLIIGAAFQRIYRIPVMRDAKPITIANETAAAGPGTE